METRAEPTVPEHAARVDETVRPGRDRGLADRPAGTPRAPLPVRPEELRVVRLFAELSASDLAWIAEQSERISLEPGEIFMQPGAPADWMFLLLEGVLQARREHVRQSAPAFILRAGDIFGAIPFSRMTVFAGTGRAVTQAVIARFPRARFSELLQRVPALTQRFASQLADRVRDATRRDDQFEKLTALGTLSAGLAHELNNPVAAVLRAMGEANMRLDERGDITVALIECGVSAEAVRRLDALRREVIHRSRTRAAEADGASAAGASAAGAALARSDREESLAGWLRDSVGARDPWTSAAVFVEAGVGQPALAEVLCDVPAPARSAALRWLETGFAAQAFFDEAEAAMRRISRLLEALQTYTHRDRTREAVDVDIREGLESTLELLAGRVRAKGVRVERALAPVPGIRAYPGDLNQVWAQLLSNALDAVPANTGVITVRTATTDGSVVAEVQDNGPGIPTDLQDRVFEPFFTTKDVGAGAGLGLDIARRLVVDLHGGELALTSTPGDTRFTVRLPLATIGTFGL